MLIRWFAENLSDADNDCFVALPTGMVFPEGLPEGRYKYTPHLCNGNQATPRILRPPRARRRTMENSPRSYDPRRG